jgi:hypothetical protein
LAAAVAVASCNGDEAPPPNWAEAGEPCWPLSAKQGGSVQVGTGDIAFQPMPDTLDIIKNGSQGDPFIEIHARIHGMPPGNPDDFLDPRNPRTKLGLVIDETGLALGIECPASLGYVPAPDGAYDLIHSLRIGFGFTPLDTLNNRQARIGIEVVGSNGLYAHDERVVILKAPPAMFAPP